MYSRASIDANLEIHSWPTVPLNETYLVLVLIVHVDTAKEHVVGGMSVYPPNKDYVVPVTKTKQKVNKCSDRSLGRVTFLPYQEIMTGRWSNRRTDRPTDGHRVQRKVIPKN